MCEQLESSLHQTTGTLHHHPVQQNKVPPCSPEIGNYTHDVPSSALPPANCSDQPAYRSSSDVDQWFVDSPPTAQPTRDGNDRCFKDIATPSQHVGGDHHPLIIKVEDSPSRPPDTPNGPRTIGSSPTAQLTEDDQSNSVDDIATIFGSIGGAHYPHPTKIEDIGCPPEAPIGSFDLGFAPTAQPVKSGKNNSIDSIATLPQHVGSDCHPTEVDGSPVHPPEVHLGPFCQKDSAPGSHLDNLMTSCASDVTPSPYRRQGHLSSLHIGLNPGRPPETVFI